MMWSAQRRGGTPNPVSPRMGSELYPSPLRSRDENARINAEASAGELRQRYNKLMHEGIYDSSYTSYSDPSHQSPAIWSPPPQKEALRRNRQSMSPHQSPLGAVSPKLYYSPPPRGHRAALRDINHNTSMRSAGGKGSRGMSPGQPHTLYGAHYPEDKASHPASSARRAQTRSPEGIREMIQRGAQPHSHTHLQSRDGAFRGPQSHALIPDPLRSDRPPDQGAERGRFPLESNLRGQIGQYSGQSPLRPRPESKSVSTVQRVNTSKVAPHTSAYAPMSTRLTPEQLAHREHYIQQMLSRVECDPSKTGDRAYDTICGYDPTPSPWHNEPIQGGGQCNAPPMCNRASPDSLQQYEDAMYRAAFLAQQEKSLGLPETRTTSTASNKTTEEKSTSVRLRKSRSHTDASSNKSAASSTSRDNTKHSNTRSALRVTASKIIQQAWRKHLMRRNQKKFSDRKTLLVPQRSKKQDAHVAWRSQSPPVALDTSPDKGVPFYSQCSSNDVVCVGCHSVPQSSRNDERSIMEPTAAVKCTSVCAFPGDEFDNVNTPLSTKMTSGGLRSVASPEAYLHGSTMFSLSCNSSRRSTPTAIIPKHSPLSLCSSNRTSTLSSRVPSLLQSAFHIPGAELISDPLDGEERMPIDRHPQSSITLRSKPTKEHMHSLVDSLLNTSRQKLALTYTEVRTIAASRIQAFWRGYKVRCLCNPSHCYISNGVSRYSSDQYRVTRVC